jgi:hypothetical protein
MRYAFFAMILNVSLLTPQLVIGAEDTQQKLDKLLAEVGYLCGSELGDPENQNLATLQISSPDKLNRKKIELQSHLAVIDGWDLTKTVEHAIYSNKERSTTKITKMIYLLGAADPSYANPVLQRIYLQSELIAITTLPENLPLDIRKEALNSSRIDITSAVIDAIELSGTSGLNEVLNQDAISDNPSSDRAKKLLKNLKNR